MTDLEKSQMLTEEEYLDACEEWGDELPAMVVAIKKIRLQQWRPSRSVKKC